MSKKPVDPRASDLAFALKAIKAAKKLGVISMKLGTLEFVISKNDESPGATRPALKVSKKAIKAAAEKALAQDKYDQAKEELATMHVEDPLGFERALVDKELEDDNSGGEQIEETLSS